MSLLWFGVIQTSEKFIICALVNLAEFDQNTGTDVQFASLIFGVCGSADVAATALQRNAQLFLRQPTLVAQPPQIVAHVAIPTDLLLHASHPAYV